MHFLHSSNHQRKKDFNLTKYFRKSKDFARHLLPPDLVCQPV